MHVLAAAFSLTKSYEPTAVWPVSLLLRLLSLRAELALSLAYWILCWLYEGLAKTQPTGVSLTWHWVLGCSLWPPEREWTAAVSGRGTHVVHEVTVPCKSFHTPWTVWYFVMQQPQISVCFVRSTVHTKNTKKCIIISGTKICNIRWYSSPFIVIPYIKSRLCITQPQSKYSWFGKALEVC